MRKCWRTICSAVHNGEGNSPPRGSPPPPRPPSGVYFASRFERIHLILLYPLVFEFFFKKKMAMCCHLNYQNSPFVIEITKVAPFQARKHMRLTGGTFHAQRVRNFSGQLNKPDGCGTSWRSRLPRHPSAEPHIHALKNAPPEQMHFLMHERHSMHA